jgi:hypothetical protein
MMSRRSARKILVMAETTFDIVAPIRNPRGVVPRREIDRIWPIVENAALVTEFNLTLVDEIEAAVGPSPAWYEPET